MMIVRTVDNIDSAWVGSSVSVTICAHFSFGRVSFATTSMAFFNELKTDKLVDIVVVVHFGRTSETLSEFLTISMISGVADGTADPFSTDAVLCRFSAGGFISGASDVAIGLNTISSSSGTENLFVKD